MCEPDPPAAATAATNHPDDAPAGLRPADPQDVLQAVAFALRYQGRRRIDAAGELTARIAAERIAEHLARSGFIVMRRPAQPPGPDRQYAPRIPGRGSTTGHTG